MKAFLVFLVAVLGCGPAGGRLVSRCELKDQLMAAFGHLSANPNRTETLVAKIVCHVELASNFDTSTVNQLDPERGDHRRREARDAGYAGLFGLAEEPEDAMITIQPRTRARRHAGRGPPKARPTSNTRPPRHDEELWTLYGLFQLSNHLVCSDGTTPSPNICGMDCSELLDDDTSDDVSCLMTICNQLVKNGFGVTTELKRMVRLIFQDECSDEDASYFAECP